MEKKFSLNDKVKMKKQHPCGNDVFEIVRVGADIKIKCVECGRIIMLARPEFKKRMKKNLTEEANEKGK